MTYTVQLNSEIAAGIGPVLYSKRVTKKGRAIRLFVHFYQGQQRELQMRARIQGPRKTQDLFQSVIAEPTLIGSIAGLNYLAGDDTTYDFPVDVDVDIGDFIVWEFMNIDAVNVAHTNTFVVFEEEGE